MGWAGSPSSPHHYGYRGYRPTAHGNGLGVASLILGTFALSTSWLIVGIPFGVAAVVTGIGELTRATPRASKPFTAVVGIALGVVAMVVGVGILVVLWPDLQQLITGDPCHPVKQHAACY
jgi:ABC-type phosphate transport system permease subunit